MSDGGFFDGGFVQGRGALRNLRISDKQKDGSQKKSCPDIWYCIGNVLLLEEIRNQPSSIRNKNPAPDIWSCVSNILIPEEISHPPSSIRNQLPC